MANDGQNKVPSALPSNYRIKLNVSGKQFETTSSTLQIAGLDSLLAVYGARHTADNNEDDTIFIDRDPDIFSAFLSLLRSGRLPSAALRRFSIQDLAEEALYYGIEGYLLSALSPPPLDGISATLTSTLVPACEAHPTAIYAGSDDGCLWIGHGGQISVYDSNLIHSGTVRTHLEQIVTIRRVCPGIAAIGSLDTPGLHFYDISRGRQVASVSWLDPSDPRLYKARVTAIGAAEPELYSRRPIFAAFECPHHENCILSIDRSTQQIVSEIGRQSGNGSKTSSPKKVVDLTETGGGVVFASAVSSGTFGYSGYIRLWDPRTGNAVWETSEPGGGTRGSRYGDAFADVDVDGKEMAIYKVCWKSGDVAVADMRKLGEDPWMYLEARSAAMLSVVGGGANSIVTCYKGQVFVSKLSGLEVWSRAQEDEGGEDGVRRKEIWTRNFMDREVDERREMIGGMEARGDRLFVWRVGVEGVEVWESSHFSGAISFL